MFIVLYSQHGFVLSDPKNRVFLCSFLIVISLVCGAYLVGNAFTTKEYKQAKDTFKVPFKSEGKGNFRTVSFKFKAVAPRTRLVFYNSFYHTRIDDYESLCGPVLDQFQYFLKDLVNYDVKYQKQLLGVSTSEPQQKLRPKRLVPLSHTSEENIVTVPTTKGGVRRKHHRAWTLVEVMKLVDGVSRCSAGRWSEIKLLSFSSHSYRTSVDLKDKWRNLLKASFAQAPADEGAFRRAGYTEASVDRVSPAGLPPVSVLSALVNDEDGSMSSLPTLTNLALEYNFPIVSITDLISSVKKEKEDMYPEME
ncbi:hypothetical protein Ahy_B10g104431 isoform B [Arachis hypogaea]|uniref:Myb-like domain-containing protein n=2 Tax=Arachis hypogaea TaxID=3818 RepID=A0A444X5G5_ARAHY|nr:hypothetical protein Ahy_B10g104431 isoform B [Arachis hypogaea]